MTCSPRVETADRVTRSAPPAPRGPCRLRCHLAHPEPWEMAQPDWPTCSSKPCRSQCRVPRRPTQRPPHKTGVVSRVPCSSRNAQAFGTDRNTYLTSTQQRQPTDSPGRLTDRRMQNRKGRRAKLELRAEAEVLTQYSADGRGRSHPRYVLGVSLRGKSTVGSRSLARLPHFNRNAIP